MAERKAAGVWSAARLFKRLVVPQRDDSWSRARLAIRPELAWQPYLFLAMFYGTVASVALGDSGFTPPGKEFDVHEVVWAVTGFFSPILAFVAVWMIVHKEGRARYVALWLRLSSDIGAMTSLLAFLTYQLPRGEEHPFDGAILGGSVVFLALLVWRDVRFLVATERVATHLYGQPE